MIVHALMQSHSCASGVFVCIYNQYILFAAHASINLKGFIEIMIMQILLISLLLYF